jgi:hypothetical protein
MTAIQDIASHAEEIDRQIRDKEFVAAHSE